MADGDNGIIAAIKRGFAELSAQVGIGQAPPAAPAPAVAPAAPIPEEIKLRMNEQQEELARANKQIEELGKQAEATRLENEKAARLAQENADLAWVESQVKAFKISPAAAEHFTALAKENPVALSALKPGIEANPAISALAGDGKDSLGSVDASLLVDGGDGKAEGNRLHDLTVQYCKEKPGTSYADAFGIICTQNKELAAHYRNATSGS